MRKKRKRMKNFEDVCIEVENKDEIYLEENPVNGVTYLELGTMIDRRDNYAYSPVSLTYDQVDTLIQKLIDIRRQWPQKDSNG